MTCTPGSPEDKRRREYSSLVLGTAVLHKLCIVLIRFSLGTAALAQFSPTSMCELTVRIGLEAQVLETKGRYDEAITEYRAFLKEDPHSPQAPQVQQALADPQNAKR